MFRSVSHQIYGDEKYYAYIRKICMDYIEIERIYFENYITCDFKDYIDHKRSDGIWGDDIELQALS